MLSMATVMVVAVLGGRVDWLFLVVLVKYMHTWHQHHWDLRGQGWKFLQSLSIYGCQRDSKGGVPPAMLSTC